jgi:hypothetical protein
MQTYHHEPRVLRRSDPLAQVGIASLALAMTTLQPYGSEQVLLTDN